MLALVRLGLIVIVTNVLSFAVALGQKTDSHSINAVRIYGVVKDSSTALVSYATITLKAVPGGETVASTNTSPKGVFEFFAVTPGAYVVAIEAPGFALKRYGVTVVPGNDIAFPDTVMEVNVPCPFTTPPAPIQPDQPIKTTLCEIMKEPDRFNGRMVQFRASVYFGFEASLLRDGKRAIWLSAGFPVTMTAPGGMRQPEPRIVLKKDAEYEKMNYYLSAFYKDKNGSVCERCRLYKEVTVDAVGLFEHVDKITTPPEQRHLVGFGHMNGYESRLVLQSVLNVVTTPIDPSIYEKNK
jgi:hypothetical protein